MREHAFTCRFPHSEHTAVIIDAEIQFALPFENEGKRLSVTAKALIDTGATGSCISRRLALACRLEQISAARIFSAQGASVVPIYEVDIVIARGAVFEKTTVMEVAGSSSFDIIIGMDILSKCDFAVSNVSDTLVFTMRIPAADRAIDFCAADCKE